jgi:hypothetical protein
MTLFPHRLPARAWNRPYLKRTKTVLFIFGCEIWSVTQRGGHVFKPNALEGHVFKPDVLQGHVFKPIALEGHVFKPNALEEYLDL